MIAQRELGQPMTLAERRRILEKQAERVVAHYEREPERSKRIEMQGGVIVEY